LEDFRDLTSVLNIYYSFFNVIKGNRNTVIAQVKLFEDETILPTNQKERKKGDQRNLARFPSISGQSQRLSNVSRVSTFSEESDIFYNRWRRIFFWTRMELN